MISQLMKFQKISMIVLGGLLITVSSCKKEEPVIPNPEEVITTVLLELVPNGGGTTVNLTFRDLDGDGGVAPVITTETLAANTTYTGSITFLNELETPAEDITEEVEEEALEHQVFYSASGGVNVTVTYNDQDTDGNPIGLDTEIVTGDVSSGKFTIVLRHFPPYRFFEIS